MLLQDPPAEPPVHVLSVTHRSLVSLQRHEGALAQTVRRPEMLHRLGVSLYQEESFPLRGGVGGHVAVENAPPVMGQHQKHVNDLEAKGGDSKEVDRDQLLDVILQERAPGLRRRLATAHHVFADTGLADVDAELEQLPVNAGCTPTGSCGSDREPREK